MAELTKEELKQVLLDILEEIDSFCKEERLTYFLSYGSLIGAVRHNGFIPWDDDVDICMPRKDYEFFIETYNTKKRSGFTSVVSFENDPDYYLSAAKVIDNRTVLHEHLQTEKNIGVYVDVFPIDYCSSDYKLALKLYKKTSSLQKLLTIKNLSYSKSRGMAKNVLLGCLKALLKPVPRANIIDKVIKVSQKYRSIQDSKYAGLIMIPDYGEREILESDWLRDTIDHEFEGRLFMIPVHYNKILTQIYGDYMQLPSKDKQISHHGFDAEWK